jgi:DNA-binding HxlR family transcriptional regulator
VSHATAAVIAAEPEHDLVTCSIEAALEVIGDRWTLLILRDAFRGIRRFDRFHEDLGVARNLLADRLNRLVDNGVLEKVPYQERPVRYEYRLTDKGRDLSGPLIALMQWGDHHLTGADGPPIVLIHAACGTPLEQLLRCPSCDEPVTATQIRSTPGPGRDVSTASPRAES